jgi:8-oxo-dGTP pyrophosphatase MutT (NUDIX family)
MGLIRDALLLLLPIRRVRQIGALPYRLSPTGQVEVLLVTVRRGERWTLPKGWPMLLRSGARAAAREAYEEAGVEGQVSQRSCGSYDHRKKVGSRRTIICRVEVYPLVVETVLEDWPEASERRRRWFSLVDAASQSANPSLATLLAKLDRSTLGEMEPSQ